MLPDEAHFDPEIYVQDTAEFIDPIIIAPVLDLDEVENEGLRVKLDAYRTLVEGIQVHVCPAAPQDCIYVVDRPLIVDEEGNCLVCGGPTN